jgi:hypothetical protein
MTKTTTLFRKKEKKAAIGFLVCNSLYATMVENILKRYFADTFDFVVISTSSRASLYAAFITVRDFLEKNFNHVFIVFNTDEDDKDKLLDVFAPPLKERHLNRQATLIPIEPTMDLWLLSYFENIETKKTMPLSDIKKALNAYMTEEDILSGKAFENIDFNILREKNKDFDSFLVKIEEKIKKFTKK